MNKLFLLIALLLTLQTIVTAQKKAMTLTDVMQFKSLSEQRISNDGRWVSASVWPDRGDGYVLIKQTRGRKEYTIELGKNPMFSNDSKWVAIRVTHPFETLNTIKKPSEKPNDGMSLLNLESGLLIERVNVKNYVFSESSDKIFVHYFVAKPDSHTQNLTRSQNDSGSLLEVIDLSTSVSTKIEQVVAFTTDSLSQYLVAFVSDTLITDNRLISIRLTELQSEPVIIQRDSALLFTNFTWDHQNQHLYYLTSREDDSYNAVNNVVRWIPSSVTSEVLVQGLVIGKVIPIRNSLKFNKEDNLLFFGVQSQPNPKASKEKSQDPFDFDSILQDVELDVWHGNDPRIKTHEKVVWNQQKNQTFLSVLNLQTRTWTQLADESLRTVIRPESGIHTLGFDDTNYLRDITWKGSASNDIYLINILTADRTLLLHNSDAQGQLSPDGSQFVYYLDRNWFVKSVQTGVERNLTEHINTPFYDEDHDSPADPNGYGIAGWNKDGNLVYIYDKYDIWQFDLTNGEFQNITQQGRASLTQFRIIDAHKEHSFLEKGSTYLVTGYHDAKKNYGFFTLQLGQNKITKTLGSQHRYRFIQKASDTGSVLYSREDYSEFPDLWVVEDISFNRPTRITNLNSQLEAFAWGTSTLVEWSSIDGKPVQGVLILPGNYEVGKKYPVIVYFYELFSQRLHEFNPQLVNHRPSFPFYASNGYAVFLPDVRYTQGLPGYSAIKYIVPGVQKIIDMGIADPNAIGLHGHSWSGYQAAHMITMTDIFAAAVTGAPVSNMTSAYSGIRWGSGLARQFQYEKTQSRIGKTLWERPDLYIENSPVFYADRINTPLLIQFGDADEAVPWYQGIELYLALRRLDKEVIFLQYHGEPHHLQKYANKLDYSIKMKEYFDHYLKGLPAAEWIKNGVPFKK